MKLKQLLCLHRVMTIVRCHSKVWYAKTHPERNAWVDRHGVFNFICCARCQKAMPVKMHDPVYEQDRATYVDTMRAA